GPSGPAKWTAEPAKCRRWTPALQGVCPQKPAPEAVYPPYSWGYPHLTPEMVLGVRKQPLRNDQSLYLARALVNPVDTGIAVGALDPELSHVTHAAVDLNGRVGDPPESLRGEELRLRCPVGNPLAAVGT